MSHFPRVKINRSPHSPQAYFIIKTIHLMNFTNADTLARIVKMCSETDKERRELCAFSSTLIQKSQERLAPKQFRPAKQPAGSKKAAGRCMQPSILCDSDSLN